MKNILALFAILIFPALTFGQVNVQSSEIIEDINSTPQEEVFVHYNSTLLFVGEYLYYKVYNLHSETSEFSSLSKIAYVELVGEDGERVFRHKIDLEDGAGQGDFFIPTGVNSGNYKLLGYTRWMINGSRDRFFEGDIAIINPYNNVQENIVAQEAQEVADTTSIEETTEFTDRAVQWELPAERTEQNIQGNSFRLTTNAEEFGRREQVNIQVRNGGEFPSGKYSVSVRKLDTIEVPGRHSTSSFRELFETETGMNLSAGASVYIPELRGEFFSGSIAPKEGTGNLSLANREVALSIPDQNFILRIARTNEAGEFYFNVEDYNAGDVAILQVLGDDKEQFEIQLDQAPEVEYTSLEYADFRITPQMKELIIDRSVHNQIENGYYEVKPDTLRLMEPRQPFYGNEMQVYDLDDYTRFKTLQETFVEFVKFVSLRKNSAGEQMLSVRPLHPGASSGAAPLLIVDGVMVQDHSDLVFYPADKIQKIGILRDRYFLGPRVFQGIVTIETIAGDFHELNPKNYVNTTEILRPQPKKSYFHQVYSSEADALSEAASGANASGNRSSADNETASADAEADLVAPNPVEVRKRTPDFRNQLLWNPNVTLAEGEGSIEFFTSDVPGTYEISVEGFTKTGIPVSLKKHIVVE